MRAMTLCLALCLPALADAGTKEAVNDYVLPAYAEFAARAEALATAPCAPDALRPAYHAAYDAWLRVSPVQFGPVETRGLSLAISFWPDRKDRTGRALARLAANGDRAVQDVDAFAEVSVAARGFLALERMLYDAPDAPADYACDLTRAITADLARSAAMLTADWAAFADVVLTAGAPDNAVFLERSEADQALYTSLLTGLAFLHDQRLGRPLGTFDRPRPLRAEARRSNRSQRNVIAHLEGLRALADTLSGGTATASLAAFDKALTRARALDDPALAGVAIPARRIRIEALAQGVREIRGAVAAEIGAGLGIAAGFNSLDGD